MLTRHNNEVFLFVSEKYHGEKFPGEVTMIPEVPFAHLKDYETIHDLTKDHQKVVNETRAMLVTNILNHKLDFILTHDIVFTGWHMPYAMGVMQTTQHVPNTKWFHWIHSVPSRMSDWWDFAMYGPNHKLIYPNKTDIIRVSEAWRTTPEDTRCIPHIKDLRTFFDFNPESRRIIDAYPGLMHADIVEVLPASSDRLTAKRVAEVIKIFSYIKRLGHSVCLFIANQWATTAKHIEDENHYLALAMKYGLEPHREVIFSSRFDEGRFKIGLPIHVLREVMMCANLFIFPTREESFGLVLPEVALASGAFFVLNRSLHMQYEVSDNQAIYFDFGSYTSTLDQPLSDKYLSDVAILTISRMMQNESLRVRTRMRQLYNMDRIYKLFYAPILSEACINEDQNAAQETNYTRTDPKFIVK